METTGRDEGQEASGNAGEAPGEYYSVEDAARILMLSRGRIRQMLRTGTLQGERGGSPQAPWRIPVHVVHALREERPPRANKGGDDSLPELRNSPQEPFESRELREKVEVLQREIGRLEVHLERTKATLQEGLDQEKRRTGREREERMRTEQEVLRLREELAAERGKRFWKVGVVVLILVTVVATSLVVFNEIFR